MVQVSSSSSGEEEGTSSSSEEDDGDDDESEGSGADARKRRGGARGRVSTREAEAKGPCIPSCPICMNEWTADGAHRVR